jgi:hypothetical protein
MNVHRENLLRDAADCRRISERATTDPDKQELFARLADHLKMLACEIERAIEQRHASNSS